MMIRYTPKVQFGILEMSTTEGEISKAISIGSVEWYTWLDHHDRFYFENAYGIIFVRKKQRADNWYWHAYRRYRGKLCKTYLGKTEELSLERLNEGVHTLVTRHRHLLTTNIYHQLPQGFGSASLRLANSVLITKLQIPPVPSNLVPRAHLSSLLDEGIRHKLTLITAPPGFGKTALLSEWGTAHRGNGLPCAWFSADESDNDPLRFLVYFISALRTFRADIGEDLLTLLLSPQLPMPLNAIMTMLINEITTKILHDFAFVFDDYHSIKTQSIHDTLTFLLDHQPSCMHIVIASRTTPPLPLARLRTQGQLTEVHARELCFLPEEIAVFMNEVKSLGLSIEDVALLAERTEGWIAALQLAALSLQKQKDFTAFIKAFTGSHHYIMDYFAEEVFRRQSQDVQIFLLRTSILTRLNNSLCETVTGQGDGQITVGKLNQANLFLFPLDEERGWYRYHHLFREFLYHQLHRSSPDIIDELHHRANAWWYEHNKLEAETIDRTIVGRDFERAIQWGHNFKDGTHSLAKSLSSRELEVLHSISSGLSNQEIAYQMCVAESTIKWHIKNIYTKLNVHNRAQLIVLAQNLKL